MPTVRMPRSGSMQFWPRKRAGRDYARIRTTPKVKESGLVGFAGYKVGMTQIYGVETNKHSHLKGEEIAVPVTVIECPPMKIFALRLYKKTDGVLRMAQQINFGAKDKELSRKLKLPKKAVSHDLSKINPEEFYDARVVVFTQPKMTGTNKKKPEVFEMGLGGSSVKDKIHYVKEHHDKEILLTNVFKDGELVDLKGVTKGKGFQGPVRRFGISLRQSKSEKAIRNPGSLGPWCGQGHIMYRVAHAGKTGYNQRTEYNKQIIKVSSDPKELNPKSGFMSYGVVKNPCVLVKGSVVGARTRLVILQKALRIKKQHEVPTILSIIK